MDGTTFGYHDGLVMLVPDDGQVAGQIPIETPRSLSVYMGQCPTCNESSEDLSMPCPRCGEIE